MKRRKCRKKNFKAACVYCGSPMKCVHGKWVATVWSCEMAEMGLEEEILEGIK